MKRKKYGESCLYFQVLLQIVVLDSGLACTMGIWKERHWYCESDLFNLQSSFDRIDEDHPIWKQSDSFWELEESRTWNQNQNVGLLMPIIISFFPPWKIFDDGSCSFSFPFDAWRDTPRVKRKKIKHRRFFFANVRTRNKKKKKKRKLKTKIKIFLLVNLKKEAWRKKK